MEARKSSVRASRYFAAIVATAALGLVLAGARCSQLGGVFEKPDLLFRGVQVHSIGFEGASVDILVDVYNPNSYRLGLERFSYDLAVENVHWGLGVTDSPIAVDARNTATLRLPLEVSWLRLGEAGREALKTGSVNYGVSGELTVATTLGSVRVPYSKTGRFSVVGGERSGSGVDGADLTARFQLAGSAIR
ncbi:MAG TPA: LEA type 2 family protein [Thermoanaerobaculia bacterium]|jgi:LEA14-like dessication related protein|nr:LEA type 2 family protein [Thermoanaerobaculia bacterium]